jgi:hypothetical protein
MESFEKIAAFLDTFSPEDENYDYACYIKHKLAEEMPGLEESSRLLDTDEDKDFEETGELANPDKSRENYEGELMEPSFKDLEEPSEKQAEDSRKLFIREFLERLKK